MSDGEALAAEVIDQLRDLAELLQHQKVREELASDEPYLLIDWWPGQLESASGNFDTIIDELNGVIDADEDG